MVNATVLELRDVSEEVTTRLINSLAKSAEVVEGPELLFVAVPSVRSAKVQYLVAIPNYVAGLAGFSEDQLEVRAQKQWDSVRAAVPQLIQEWVPSSNNDTLLVKEVSNATVVAFKLTHVYCGGCVWKLTEAMKTHASEAGATSPLDGALIWRRGGAIGDFLFAVSVQPSAEWWIDRVIVDVFHTQCEKGVAYINPLDASFLLMDDDPALGPLYVQARSDDFHVERNEWFAARSRKVMSPPVEGASASPKPELESLCWWNHLEKIGAPQAAAIPHNCTARLANDVFVSKVGTNCGDGEASADISNCITFVEFRPLPDHQRAQKIIEKNIAGFGVRLVTPENSQFSCLMMTVNGMSCQGCANGLQEKLSQEAGVRRAVVRHSQSAAAVCFDRRQTSIETLQSFITQRYSNSSLLPIIKEKPSCCSAGAAGGDVTHVSLPLSMSLLSMAELKDEGLRCENIHCQCESCSCSNCTCTGTEMVERPVDCTSSRNSPESFTQIRLLTFTVEGMSCGSCAARIQAVVKEEKGVLDAEVDFSTKSAKVRFSTESINAVDLTQKVESLGYTIPPHSVSQKVVSSRSNDNTSTSSDEATPTANLSFASVTKVDPTSNNGNNDTATNVNSSTVAVNISLPKKHTFVVKGMTCASCAARIESTLKKVEHVEAAVVNFATASATVTFDAAHLSWEKVTQTIESLGFTAIYQAPRTAATKGSATTTTQPPGRRTYIVKGMTCASCAARIESVLQKEQGIHSATVNFAVASASVDFDPQVLTAEQIQSIIRALGYEVQLQAIRGAANPQGAATGGSADDAHDEAMDAARSALERNDEIEEMRRRFLFSLCFTVPLFVLMVATDRDAWLKEKMHTAVVGEAMVGELVGWALASPVVLRFGWPFFHRAYLAAKHRAASMDTLVAVGVGSAYGFSVLAVLLAVASVASFKVYFDASATLLTFMILGKYLEARAKRGTSGALLTLMSLAPSTAIKVAADGTESEVQVAALAVGDTFRVPSGCRIAVDGTVTSGTAAVDESLITGESVPVDKVVGDEVVAGTLVVNTDLVVRATKVGDETTLARILKVVQEAQTTKPAIQRLADRIAGVFVPIVIIFSLLVLAVWLVLSYADLYPASWREDKGKFIFSFSFFLASVVVACPCALGLATPTAIMVGTGVGAQHGVLIKDGPTLETTASVRIVLFDKTGTLTTGKLALENTSLSVNPNDASLQGLSATELKQIVGTIESRSNHPVATAVTSAYGTLPSAATSNLVMETKSGSGLEGKLVYTKGEGEGRRIPLHVIIGKPSIVEATTLTSPIDTQLRTAIDEGQEKGHTIVVAIINGAVSLVCGLSDQPKPDAAACVRALHRSGVEVFMVSGDHPKAAKHIAKEVGIKPSHVHAEVMPWNKAEVVREHQEKGKVVCFVGDGMNDSPALAQADVGVALGAGTEVAIDAADAILMKNSLADLVMFLDLSKTIIRRVYFNFVWALCYNLVALPLASGLLFAWWQTQVPPVVAGGAMVCSSLSVLLSSLALKLYKRPKF